MTARSHITFVPHAATTRTASRTNDTSDKTRGRWTRRPLVTRNQRWPCAIRAGRATGSSVAARAGAAQTTTTSTALTTPAVEGRESRRVADWGWWAGDVSIAI